MNDTPKDKTLGDKTVFLFTDGLRIEEFKGKHLQLPYWQYCTCAFTVDPTARNLPPQNQDWTFLNEVQPGYQINIWTDHEAIRRGIREKGWYVGRVDLGASAYSKAASLNPTPKEDLTQAAKELLADLLKEPKRI